MMLPKLRFPEFQNTEDWQTGMLGDKNVATFVKERIPLEKLNLESYVSTENLLPNYAGVTTASKLPPAGSCTRFKTGDVLISNIRPYLKKVWIANKDGASSNDVIVIRSQQKVSDSFLALLLKNDEFINYIMKGAKGVKMPRGDISLMKEYIVAFPRKESGEQTKIAACLSSLDDLITAQTQKIAALKTHKKGLMQQLFPQEGETVPKLRFPEFMDSGEWLITSLIEICDVKGGKRIPKGSGFSFEKTGFPYIRVTDMFMGGVDVSSVLHITEDVEKSIKNYKISKEDLFITVAGTIGIVGEIPDELDNANLTENANKIVIKKCCKKYLLQYLSSDYLQSLIASSITNNAQPKLALERIRNFPIPTPCHTEQQKIAACLSSLDELINAQVKKLNALKLHKKGLMQGLFPSSNEAA